MNKEKLEKIMKIAEENYSKEDYKYHILQVVKYSLLLAKRLNADLEIVEISAYLHDIGRAKKKRKFEGEIGRASCRERV